MGDRLAKVASEVEDLRVIGSQPSKYGSAAWIAEWNLIIRARETHARAGQPINIRSLRHRVAVTTERGPEVINGDEENVGPA